MLPRDRAVTHDFFNKSPKWELLPDPLASWPVSAAAFAKLITALLGPLQEALRLYPWGWKELVFAYSFSFFKK